MGCHVSQFYQQPSDFGGFVEIQKKNCFCCFFWKPTYFLSYNSSIKNFCLMLKTRKFHLKFLLHADDLKIYKSINPFTGWYYEFSVWSWIDVMSLNPFLFQKTSGCALHMCEIFKKYYKPFYMTLQNYAGVRGVIFYTKLH